MEAVGLDYRRCAPGMPLERVLGLSLVQRAVLTCQKSGAAEVILHLHGEDMEAVSTLLESDARISTTLRFSADVSEEVVAEAPSLRGDLVFLPAALEMLLSDASHQEESGATWQLLESDADRVAAGDLLMASLVKEADGVISRNINRRISCFISRRIADTSVHPNHVTAIVGLIGFAAFPLAMQGTWEGYALGGLCYYVSAILDGVDGELSRLKHLGSPLGAWLDTLTDDAVCVAWLLGLFWGLSGGGEDGTWTAVGAITLGSFFLTVGPRYWLMLTSVGAGDHQKIAAARKGEATEPSFLSRVIDGLAATVFRTDFLPFYAFVTALFGGAEVFAWSFAVGSVLAMVETFFTVRAVRKMSV